MPGPQVAAQLAAVQAVLSQHLGERLRAVHLYGSATEGGLRPHSDLDLMVTVTAPLPDDVRERLMLALLPHSAWPGTSASMRALEVTVVALEDVVPWRYPPQRQMQFGEWLRADLQAGRFEPAMPDPDLAILITQLRGHGVALSGPPAAKLFAPVPAADLRRALADTLAQWNGPADWQGEERNILLALARIWFTACTGRIAAKDAAAAWAIERLPAGQAAVMRRALDAYLGTADDTLAAMPGPVAAVLMHCKGEAGRALAAGDATSP